MSIFQKRSSLRVSILRSIQAESSDYRFRKRKLQRGVYVQSHQGNKDSDVTGNKARYAQSKSRAASTSEVNSSKRLVSAVHSSTCGTTTAASRGLSN